MMKTKGLIFEDAEFLSNARILGLNDSKKLKDSWQQRFVYVCGGEGGVRGDQDWWMCVSRREAAGPEFQRVSCTCCD